MDWFAAVKVTVVEVELAEYCLSAATLTSTMQVPQSRP